MNASMISCIFDTSYERWECAHLMWSWGVGFHSFRAMFHFSLRKARWEANSSSSAFFSNERFGTLHWKKDSLFFCHLCIFLIFVLSYWCCEVCLLFFVIVHNLHTIRRQSGSCLRTCVFAFLLRRRFWWSNFCDFSKPSCKTMTLHMILLPGT